MVHHAIVNILLLNTVKSISMTPTLTQMQTWFDEFNKLVFSDTLPKVKISFNNTRCQLGQFYWGCGRGVGIKISLFWDRTEDQFRNCLLHEMCHLYCYNRGWINEGHSCRWQDIADYAYRKTGLYIQRCEDIAGWEAAGEANKEKLKAVNNKKNAPAILLDLCYGDHHFIVKTTKKVLDQSTDFNCSLRTAAKSYKVFISDAPLFTHFQTSRSIHRGYKYENWQYERDIKPLFDRAIEVDSLRKLFQGDYNRLGINVAA